MRGADDTSFLIYEWESLSLEDLRDVRSGDLLIVVSGGVARIVFNDFSIDLWFQIGKIEAPVKLLGLILAGQLELDVDIHSPRTAKGRVEGIVFVCGCEKNTAFLRTDAIKCVEQPAKTDSMKKVNNYKLEKE